MRISNHIYQKVAVCLLHIGISLCASLNATTQIIHDDIKYQTERRTFKHYTTASGLSANRVFDLEADNKGGLWIATDFGMDRFDGRTFRHFGRDEYPEIKRRDIRTLMDTKDGMLVGSANGLLIYYNEKEDYFADAKPSDYDTNYYKEITGFFDFGNEIYASTIGGIYKWDEEARQFSSDFPAFVSMQNTYVRCMYRDRRGRYWLGAIETLEVFDKKGKCLKVFGAKENVKGMVFKIVPLGRDKIMVCTSGDKYIVFDTSKEELDPEAEITVPFISTYDALISRNGDIYIGTDGTGLWRMTVDKNWKPTFTHIVPFGDAYNDMKKIYSLCETEDGDLWVGTQRGGVFRMARKGIEDVSFSSEIGLEKTVCSDFIELDNGEIVATSDGDGILILSPDLEVTKRIKTPCDNMLSANLEKDGKVRTCTWGEGCVIYDPKTGKCEVEQFKGINPRPKCIFTTMQTRNGDIYVCTAGVGLLRKRSGKETWEKVPLEEEGYADTDMWVFRAIEAKDGAIWVITTNTVWEIRNGVAKHKIDNIRAEKTNNPMWLTDIANGTGDDVLISTNRGVMRIGKDGKAEFLDYIPKLEYMSIEKMRDGRHCATAFGGTIIIDEKGKKYHDLPGNFKDMEKSQFYTFSLRELNNGTLLAGTYSGFYIFNPKVVSREESTKNKPEVKKVFCGGKKLNLKERIIKNTGAPNEIEISNEEARNIQIDIEQTDFRSQAAYHLYYRLKEEGDEWNTVDQEKSVMFTFLPQGTHTLQIAYSPSAEGIEEANCASIRLKVMPPWWRSLWFITLSALAFLGLLFGTYKIRIMKMQENEEQLKQKVAERTSDLQKALADKEGLISVIAHDLKNPLFGIVGQLEESIRHNEGTDERVKKAYQQAANLQRAMRDLVDWAKEKREKLVPIIVETDLSAMAESAISLHTALIENKEITLRREYNADMLAMTDERLTTTILRNLIGNSVKYTPRGGEICVETAEKEGKVTIAVKDNGVGMSEAQIKEILEGKNDGKGTDGTEGEKSTGMGMSIVKDYAERLGAGLEIESEKGRGTTVTLIFEASTNQQKEKMDAKEADGTADNDTELKGKKILVAEDDELVRDYLKDALDGICKVYTAQDGEVALETLRKEDIDIVLSDMQMPKKNGLQLCQDMNADTEMRHLPFIFMSATSSDGLKIQGLDAGAIDFINKPFDIRELKIKLGNVLRISRLAAKKQAETMMRGKPEEKEKADPFAKKFMETLESVYNKSDMSVGTLSSMLNMSTATLGRKCLASLGKSPMQLLQDMRMAKALEMLKNKETEETISEISYKVGFADPAYFSRKFKEHFGFNPSEVI